MKKPKDVSLLPIIREEKITRIIQLLFSGKSKLEACQETGISERTFDRAVAQSPELLRIIQSTIRTNFSTLVDDIIEGRKKNTETFLQEADEIRKTLPDQDTAKRSRAIGNLIKLDAHLSKTMDFIYPVVKDPQDEVPTSGDNDARAMEILSTVHGAKLVKVTKQTITLENTTDVINA